MDDREINIGIEKILNHVGAGLRIMHAGPNKSHIGDREISGIYAEWWAWKGWISGDDRHPFNLSIRLERMASNATATYGEPYGRT
jgi:hypothetical protein